MPADDSTVRRQVKDNASTVADIAGDIAKELGLTPEQQAKAKADAAAAYAAGTSVANWAFSKAAWGADKFLYIFIAILTKIRNEGTAGLPNLTAEVLNEFLGTDFTGDQFGVLSGKDVTITRAHQIGAKVLARLTEEFAPAGTVTPQSGEEAARRFTGFAVNFGIQTGILGLIGGLVPEVHLDEVREMGVEAARNIGLGRLVRGGLKPLIDNTVTKPYDRALRQRYRPDLMGDTELAKAYATGKKAPAAARAELQQKGYTDEDIELLLDLLVPGLSVSALGNLERNGAWPHDAALAELARRGTPNTIAEAQLQNERLQRVDSVVSEIVTQQRAKVLDGYLSPSDFDTILGALPLSPEERDWLSRDVGLRLATPRSDLTWTQIQDMFMAGIIGFDRMDKWLSDQGYSADDSLSLEFWVLQKLDAKVTKADAAAKKAAAKAANAAAPPTKPA